MPIGQGWPLPHVAFGVTLLIEFEDSNFISWLLYNQCEQHTTCETVNKSCNGIPAHEALTKRLWSYDFTAQKGNNMFQHAHRQSRTTTGGRKMPPVFLLERGGVIKR